ncbi:hypothetical protein [Vibrio sp. F74]
MSCVSNRWRFFCSTQSCRF